MVKVEFGWYICKIISQWIGGYKHWEVQKYTIYKNLNSDN